MADGGRLPITFTGAREPMPIVYRTAGAVGAGQVGGAARGPGRAGRNHRHRSRSHAAITPRSMLTHFGAEVAVSPEGAHGRRIALEGQPELNPAPVVVPADPSSAAFPLVAALIVPGSDIVSTT